MWFVLIADQGVCYFPDRILFLVTCVTPGGMRLFAFDCSCAAFIETDSQANCGKA